MDTKQFTSDGRSIINYGDKITLTVPDATEQKIKYLVKTIPNDQELGEKIRQLIHHLNHGK